LRKQFHHTVTRFLREAQGSFNNGRNCASNFITPLQGSCAKREVL